MTASVHQPQFSKVRHGRKGYIVMYRDAQGTTHEARVVSAGTGSGLKLKIDTGYKAAQRVIDNVPLATGPKSVSSYFHRYPRSN